MANDSIVLLNAATGEEIVREMTDEEQAQRNAEIAQWIIEKEAREQQKAQLRATKISAYQKLGLTEAEIEALLPANKRQRLSE